MVHVINVCQSGSWQKEVLRGTIYKVRGEARGNRASSSNEAPSPLVPKRQEEEAVAEV